MSDNVTSIEIAQFTSWGIPLLSAIGGAVVALVGRELIEWVRRPRLTIDFEKKKELYPVIQDYRDESVHSVGVSHHIVYLRLNVFNKGKTTAYDCEAKLELIAPKMNEHYNKSLHWSKRDPGIYKSLDQIYSPLTLNRNDDETVDVLSLKYKQGLSDKEPIPALNIETYSPGVLILGKNEDFYIKVTIYARNTTSHPFYFKVNWDGSIPGFWKAFTKLNKLPKETPIVQQTI